MGRWKDDGSGKPVWDANDTGPDQIQGMPPGGPQGGSGAPPSGGGQGSPSGGGQEAPAGGWGPIKISTHYQPDPGNPHPFDGWINRGGNMPPGQNPDQGGMGIPQYKPRGDEWWNQGKPQDQWGGPPQEFPPYGIPGGNQGPIFQPFPGNGSPWFKNLLQPQGPNPNAPTPNEGETPQEMFQRFQNDYHSDDKDQVMDTMRNSDYYGTRYHMMDQNQATDRGGWGDWGKKPMPVHPGLIGAGGAAAGGLGGGGSMSSGVLRALLGGAGGGSGLGAAGGGMNPLIQQLLARRMNGGQ